MNNFGCLEYRCNICGAGCRQLAGSLRREVASCSNCGSTVRMRAMIHSLSCALFGQSIALPDFPNAKEIRGIGMSDWLGYAIPLAEKLDYLNTYYHQEPRLDITNISATDVASVDFIISTDVFEHVCPPVSVAFENAAKMLKPEGALVFSVPYNLPGDTVEHFPDLHDFTIEERDGERVLINRTAAGVEQVYSNLVFHGGPGDTLEMRVFSRPDLLRNLADAGFQDVRIMQNPCFEFGIWHANANSLPLVARRERATLVVHDFGPEVVTRCHASSHPDIATFWVAHDPIGGGFELTIGGVPVDCVATSHETTGVIPQEILSAAGSYPVVMRDKNRTRPVPVGTLFVVD